MVAKSNLNEPDRLGGLWRFAASITAFNILGHTVLGFEQSWAAPLVALATAYSTELLLEQVTAWSGRRRPKFTGGIRNFAEFLLPAHISALAIAMLLYANERLWPIAFAAAAAISSKILFRAPVGQGTRHIFNPSNFGIAITLLLFPWVGFAPPYHFTENLSGAWDWIVPGIIILAGGFLNARFTHKLPLIITWVSGFIAQAFVRSLIFGTSFTGSLIPLTGVAFLLYTFYMLTDPATSPNSYRAQIVFGLGVATTYGLLLSMHIVFGLSFALTIVCAVRGLWLYIHTWTNNRGRAKISQMHTPVITREV